MGRRAFRAVACVCLATGALIAACGGDDDGATTPSGADGGLDSATTDSAVTDAGIPDSTANQSEGSFFDPTDAGDAGPAVDAAPPAYVTQFCQDYLTATLSYVTTCCPSDLQAPSVIELENSADYSPIACIAFYTQALLDERVHYLPQNTQTCLTNITYQASDCPDGGGIGTPKTDPTCQLVFSGVKQPGEACIGDQDCANGVPCQGSTCTAAATEAGAPCAFSNSRDSDPGLFAQRQRCIVGESCNGQTCAPPGQLDAGCSVDTDCVKGLYCTAAFGGACATLVIQDAGGPCDEDKFCNTGLSCQDGGCTARLDAGATCTDQDINGTQCAGYCNIPDGGDAGTCHTFCGSP